MLVRDPLGPLCLLFSSLACFVQAAAPPALELAPPNDLGWLRLRLAGQTGTVYTIEASTDLAQWLPVATTHDGIQDWADPASALLPNRFYRAAGRPRAATDDWRNQVQLPSDPFLSIPDGVAGPDFRWVKFAIVLDEPFRVYYQHSQKYDFHYDFARQRLDPFRRMTPAEFDQVALRTNQQQVLLGAVLVPPYPHEAEYGIQFAGADAYAPAFVGQFFDVVKSTVAAGEEVGAFYVPAYEQARVAETHREYFSSRGIQVATSERWISGDDIYSAGWALGRLTFVKGEEINAAFADGRLRPEDILLTDGVPAEIPVLAGALTLTPSTPNSHVAILFKSFGLPFAYLSDAAQRLWVQQLIGKDILLRLDPSSRAIRIVELEPGMDPGVRREILSLKAPPRLEIVAKEKLGSLAADTANLTPADIRFFGGKASNFGYLRRQIPHRSPEAIGISFDLWDEFLDQVLPGGATLRMEIDNRLSRHDYPPDVAALKQDLAEIRSLITRTARFTEVQKQAILGALSGFSTNRNIRFRSSTNVEDSEQFTGAGLYDSFSGCLADDQDLDNTGPSHCDPTEENERGVFRAIQKVYASFYNDNAVIERLRHRVNEAEVGMALLVHYSAPDETELANGVATLEVSRGGDRDSDSLNGDLVTQKGAVSVTNPDGTAKPEVVRGYHHSFGAGGFLSQRSSLVPLGAYVMEWDADYVELMKLFARVADGYHAYFPAKRQFTLDFEYKKLVPGILDIKQVREVPVIAPTNALPTYLVHETNSYWVLQGEVADVFSNHRLKSFWSFHTRNLKLAGTNLAESLFTHLNADYLQGKQVQRLSGAPATLPDASHRVEGGVLVDSWTLASGSAQLAFELKTEVRRDALPGQAPVLTLKDCSVHLGVKFAQPQPTWQWEFDGFKQVMVNSHAVVLEPRRTQVDTNNLQQRTASSGNLAVRTQFYWPAPPGRGIIEKTAPLAQWKETRIEGLTSQPIVLRGEFSQTYRPGHHNFSEEFVFEPELEEGLPVSLLQELREANVQLIHVLFNFEESQMAILGVDRKFRALPAGTPGKGARP